MSAYRFTPIKGEIWHDRHFQALSLFGRYTWFYLLTCPAANIIGMFVLMPGTVMDEMDCDFSKRPPEWFIKGLPDRFPAGSFTSGEPNAWIGLAEIIREGMVMYDPDTKVIWLKNYLKHNKIPNNNCAIGAARILKQLQGPPFIEDCLKAADLIPGGFADKIRHHFEGVAKPVS